jgi:hypothetical protein
MKIAPSAAPSRPEGWSWYVQYVWMYILAAKKEGIVWLAAEQGRQQVLAELVYKSPHFFQAASDGNKLAGEVEKQARDSQVMCPGGGSKEQEAMAVGFVSHKRF